MARCLITGGAGFIGSHLAEALLKADHQVIVVDVLTETYDPMQKEANLTIVQAHPKAENFQFICEDILGGGLVDILEKTDWVFHLAAEPGVRQSWGEGFAKYVKRNVLATQKLLEACRGQAIKKLVFASSSSVYGNGKEAPSCEEDRCEPFSPYGVTKLAAENLCLAYANNFDLPAVAVRYFTVFGPRQRPDMAFHRFLQSALAGEAIKIFGDGKQTRDFTYVTDAVSGTIAAAEKGQSGKVYNIGGGCLASVNDVIKILEDKIIRKKLVLAYEENAKGDVRQTKSDNSRAIKELSFKPKVHLEEGLAQEFNWLREFSAR